jgi:hypothetical protein
MLLRDLYAFSRTADYSKYSRWVELDHRRSTDDTLVFRPEEEGLFASWDKVRSMWLEELPRLRNIAASYRGDLGVVLAEYEKAVKDSGETSILFEFYKSVLETLTDQYLTSLSGMLTEVYQSVYANTAKRVVLTMEDYRNKKVVKLNLVQHINGQDFKEDFSNDGGGSEHIILGMIVAIYYLLTTGGERIMFIDESLSALHSGVLERFLAILKHFSESLGFVFVIIEHAAYRLKGYVDKVYTVSEGVYLEVEDINSFMESTLG